MPYRNSIRSTYPNQGFWTGRPCTVFKELRKLFAWALNIAHIFPPDLFTGFTHLYRSFHWTQKYFVSQPIFYHSPLDQYGRKKWDPLLEAIKFWVVSEHSKRFSFAFQAPGWILGLNCHIEYLKSSCFSRNLAWVGYVFSCLERYQITPAVIQTPDIQ